METDTDNQTSPVVKDEPENEAASNEIEDGEEMESLNGDSGGIIAQKLYSSEKEKDKKHTNPSSRENNGGLIIVDISKDICKVDSDDSESDDFMKINDINRNKGLKRKASDATRSGDDEGSRSTETEEFGSLAKKLLKDEPVLSDSDFNIQKQTLGKGKRARIPNKRYSDILISPNRRLENGSERTSESEDTPPVKETTPQHPKKLRSAPGNANDPNFLEPFKFGWKRELVWRAISDERHKIAGDIYYYTPTGKKIRSLRELSEILKNDPNGLGMENFTFMKEPLGTNDPEKEIIRDAKRPSSTVKKVVTKSRSSKSGVVSPKKVSSPKVGKGSSEGSDSKSRSSSKNLGNFKIKAPSKGKSDKKFKPDESIESDLDAIKNSTPRKPQKWTSNSNNSTKPCQPCSIRCHGVQGAIPTLQCRICLCLYHHECVGYTMHPTLPYVCKNCNLEDQTTGELSETSPLTSPPPLTPINALKAINTTTNVLPKLQRIPRNDVESGGEREEPVSASPPTLEPQLPPPMRRPSAADLYPPPPPPPTLESSKSLVGAMTTWLPHNSKIVNESTEAPRPQYLEVLNGRKFLVIPKHNFMSVSPTVAATASSRRPSINLLTEEPNPVPIAASLGVSNAEEEMKIDPESPSKPENAQTQEAERREEQQTDDNEENNKENENEVSESNQSKGKSRAPPAALNAVSSVDYPHFMSNYLQNVSYGYRTLLFVFQYLKVQDLLRAGCVCTLWRDIASQSQLWRTVRMKNSQVHSFEGLANTLRKHGTVHLDLRKMLLPGGGDEIWPQFSQAIRTVDTLKKIEFCRCPAKVVEQVAEEKTDLEVINAVTIKCECMSLEPFANLKNIKELKLKSIQGLTLTSDLKALKELKQLKILSLTSIKDLNKLDLSIIAELSSLESLDLGECTDFQENFGEEILAKLVNLEKLRLEKGQGECHTFDILKAVKDMKKLEQLELVNFDIKPGFDLALGNCSNIKKLLIIPTYISQSATTNHMVLGGVLRLHKSLSHFVWGVTLELLRVTELFVDQQSDDTKKEKKESKRKSAAAGGGDSCIPVLKPVPVIVDGKSDNILPAHDPPQVEILPLPNLQKLLLQSLPNTRVKILKIPFHATWRQSITDSVMAK